MHLFSGVHQLRDGGPGPAQDAGLIETDGLPSSEQEDTLLKIAFNGAPARDSTLFRIHSSPQTRCGSRRSPARQDRRAPHCAAQLRSCPIHRSAVGWRLCTRTAERGGPPVRGIASVYCPTHGALIRHISQPGASRP